VSFRACCRWVPDSQLAEAKGAQQRSTGGSASVRGTRTKFEKFYEDLGFLAVFEHLCTGFSESSCANHTGNPCTLSQIARAFRPFTPNHTEPVRAVERWCAIAETVMDDGLTLNIDVGGDNSTHAPHLGWRERKEQVRMCASAVCLLPRLLQQSGHDTRCTFAGS
jgi:hypothetical protein